MQERRGYRDGIAGRDFPTTPWKSPATPMYGIAGNDWPGAERRGQSRDISTLAR